VSRVPTSAPSVSLVVPLYNEEERVLEHIGELAAFVGRYGTGSELLLVDDGSVDATVATVEKVLAGDASGTTRLIRRPHAGKGAAVRAGLLEATADHAAFCDVDLATPLDDFARVIAVAEDIEGLALASRGLPESRLEERERRSRELLGRLYNRLLRATIAPGIHDTQCGAKAAPLAVWRVLLERSREDGFAWDAEVVAIAHRLHLPMREVPVEWHHDTRTSVRVIRDGWAMVSAVPRIAWRSRRW